MIQPDTLSGWTLRPAAEDVRTAAACGGLLLLLFVAVYGGCNWLTAQRGDVHRLHFEWELAIPLVPAMVCAYLSLNALFVLPVFCLRRDALLLLARRLGFATLLSGAIFLLAPAELGYARQGAVPGWETTFELIHRIDRPYNLVPSLHIIFSALILGKLRTVSPPWLRRVFAGWFVLICMSVVLVHQHHVLDVAGGLLVTWLVTRVVRAPGAARAFEIGFRRMT